MNFRPWLANIPWDLVVWQNLQLCNDKRANHGPTSDGYNSCRELRESSQMKTVTLDEMVDFCRRCHRLAPFTNYNGNTFAAIVRALIDGLGLPKENAAVARSLAGHIVAGVASEEEVKAFEKFCAGLD
ncbi:hypothetical protein HQ447_02805 [bacterium]|nr:hypothetical protein [bacterium]